MINAIISKNSVNSLVLVFNKNDYEVKSASDHEYLHSVDSEKNIIRKQLKSQKPKAVQKFGQRKKRSLALQSAS